MQVINTFDEEKTSVRELAKRFHIGKTQAAEIIKKREDIRAKWHAGTNVNQKRSFFKTEGLQVDKLCYEWFVKARNKSIPISGPLLKAKAKEIAEKIDYNDFRASDGWLHKFRIRHNISFKCISGESASVNSDDVQQFFEKIPSLLLGYRPEDVYNADETGLFFRALPNKTLAFKSEKCVGGKCLKKELPFYTVSVCQEKKSHY